MKSLLNPKRGDYKSRSLLLDWRPSLLYMLNAIALGLEAIAGRLEAIAGRFKAIAGWLEAIAISNSNEYCVLIVGALSVTRTSQSLRER